MSDPSQPPPQLPPIPEGCGILPISENRLHGEAGPEAARVSSADGDRMEQTYRLVLARALALCAGAMLLTSVIAASLVENLGGQQNPLAGTIASKAIFVTQLLFLAFCGRFIQKLSMAAAAVLLFTYAGFCGLEFSALLPPAALAVAFLCAGLMYGATAAWGFVRGTDLARPIVPIFMILGGGLTLVAVNLALGTGHVVWTLSSIAVTVFGFLAGSHAQEIRDFYQDFDDDNAKGWKASLVGALLLLFSLVNVYLLVAGFLMQIASLLSGDDEKESLRDNLPG